MNISILKKLLRITFLGFFLFFDIISICIPLETKHFVILITSYNNAPWVKKNLDSIFIQKYKNFEIIYVDDASKDLTADIAEQYIVENGFQDKLTLIRNSVRVGAHENIYNVIQKCNDDDIIVILDGDDWFANEDVLSLLNKVYSDPSIWVTYGQFRFHPTGMAGGCRVLSNKELQELGSRQFRANYTGHIFSHLRSFYVGLYKKIDKKDIMHKGKFLFVAGDVAIMLPMMEMAKNGHFKFISDVLYIYSRERVIRPEFNQRERATQAVRMFEVIRKKNPYKPLEFLF